MIAVVDRLVQYPNRYKLTNAETGEELGTFDFDEVAGTVQQVGTEINKALFDSIATDLAARVVSNGGELSRTIVTFPDISGTAANVASGDTSATLWGKVKNWFSRLKALAFKNKVAAGDFEAGAIKNVDVAADAAIAQSKVSGLMTDYVASISVSGRTVTYKNKNGANMGSITTQDTTYGLASQSSNGLMSSTDKTKLDGIESGAQKNTVLGVKGGSESAYRTGNVNITKANVGLGNVDNVKQYSASNPPPYPVTSVNNKTGAVSLSKSDVGLGNVDNVKQYSSSNPPPYPVTSVNGLTGAVNLTTADVEVISGLAFDENFGQTSGNIVGYRIGDLAIITVRFVPGSKGIAWRDWALATGLPLPRVEGNLSPNPQYVGMCMPATPCALSADGIADVQFNLRVYEKSSRLWIHRCTTTNGSKVGAGIEFNGTIVYVCE